MLSEKTTSLYIQIIKDVFPGLKIVVTYIYIDKECNKVSKNRENQNWMSEKRVRVNTGNECEGLRSVNDQYDM